MTLFKFSYIQFIQKLVNIEIITEATTSLGEYAMVVSSLRNTYIIS